MTLSTDSAGSRSVSIANDPRLKRSMKVLGIVLVAVAAVVGTVLLIVGAVSPAAQKVSEQFMAATAAGDTGLAYRLVSPAFRANISESKFIGFDKELGRQLSHQRPSPYAERYALLHNKSGQHFSYLMFLYKAPDKQLKTGELYIKIGMQKVGSRWLVSLADYGDTPQ